MTTIYIFDPRLNIQEETTIEKVMGFTGFTRKTILYVAREKRRLSVTGCYLSKEKFTTDERRHLHSLEAFPLERWRDISGYGGSYQVSDHGRVRSRRHSGKDWVIMAPYFRKTSASTFVKLTYNGHARHARIASLVYETFIGKPDKQIIVHKNQIPYDNHLWNLEAIPRSEHAKKTSKHSTAVPVFKIDPDTLEILDEYASLKEASEENFTCYKLIRKTCQGERPDAFGMHYCYASRYEELTSMQLA